MCQGSLRSYADNLRGGPARPLKPKIIVRFEPGSMVGDHAVLCSPSNTTPNGLLK